MAWAFATAGEPVPAVLAPICVLDAIEMQGAKPQVMCYQMSMQGLAATGQIMAGFVLLERAEASRLLSHFDDTPAQLLSTGRPRPHQPLSASTGNRPHSAALTGQIKEVATIEMLLRMHCVH